MARPPKVPLGKTRSVLFRTHQLEHLAADAEGLGVELSDVVRLAVDWWLAEPALASRARSRAALELAWRGFGPAFDRDPAIGRAVLEGWAGGEPALPLAAAGRAGLAGRVQRLVGLLRRSGLPLPPPGRPTALPADWASAAPDEVLEVVASGGVRAVEFDGDRPAVVEAAPPVHGGAGGWSPGAVPEALYDPPARALADMLRRGAATPTAAAGPGPIARYRLEWDLLRSPGDGG